MKARQIAAWLLLTAGLPVFAADRVPDDADKKAKEIHAQNPLVDGHNDLPWELRERDNTLTKIDLNKDQSAQKLHTDFVRMHQGGVGLQLWSAYVPHETQDKHRALLTTLEQIDLIHRMVAAYPDKLALVSTAEEAKQAIKEGRIASMIGVEGGYSIEESLAVLRTFYRLGVRYMTLTHSKTTSWADSATDAPKHKGLTDFGKELVREMNRIGMLVDISHVSADTMRAALEVSQAPVIASHSSAYAITPHPRNVPDDVLKLVAKNGGVIMVNFYSGYVNEAARKHMEEVYGPQKKILRAKYKKEEDYKAAMKAWASEHPMPAATLADVADHIDHIVQVAGIEHVGIGSDFDGVDSVPKGLADVSAYPNLTAELLRRGYKQDDIVKILGGNFFRVLAEAEKQAEKLQRRSQAH